MEQEKTSLEWYAKKILPECQISKFRYRQDLLGLELERESVFPEVSNVISDIFLSVKERNYKKFLFSHRQLGGRVDEETLRYSIRHSLLSKKEALSKREAQVLTLLLSGKSLLEVF